MKKKRISFGIRLLVVLAFVIMIAINAFTNLFKLNDVSLGDILRINLNLFVPAQVIYIIWGIIYLVLLFYIINFVCMFRTIEVEGKADLYNYVAIGFIVSTIANTAWIFSWYYDLILFSMICIGILFVSLALIDVRIKKEELDTREIFFLRVPFSLYFGWITLVTVINVTILLIKFSWDGFGASDEFWTILLICFTAILGTITIISGRDPVYGLAVLWGFIGILINHVSENGFEGYYSDIIIELIICIVIFSVLILYYLCSGKSYSKRILEEYDEEFDFSKTEEDIEEQENLKHWIKKE